MTICGRWKRGLLFGEGSFFNKSHDQILRQPPMRVALEFRECCEYFPLQIVQPGQAENLRQREIERARNRDDFIERRILTPA